MLPAAWLLIAYLLGAFPTGVVLGTLFADTNPMSLGSGNIGATNMNRVLGRGFGAATLLFDLLKGLGPVLVAPWVLDHPLYVAAVGMLAFLGHCYSPFLDFKGGKGVATGAGVMLGVAWLPTLLAAAGWLLTVAITRKSSLGALVAVLLLPVTCAFLAPQAAPLAVLLGLGIVWRHKANIQRLRAGSEH